MTYTDSLAIPVTLTSPPDESFFKDTKNVNLKWETLPGATRYEWQLDYNTDFSKVPAGFEDFTQARSARSPDLEIDETYYWRVRAIEPVLSRWSEKWSFTTEPKTTIKAPKLQSPKDGATNVPIKPWFQWSAIDKADSYELLVSTDATFSNLIIIRTDKYVLPKNKWQSNINLDYNTTYYWKVRAVSDESYSKWSTVSSFTTELPPSPPSPEPETPPPPSGHVSSLPLPSSPPPPSPTQVQSNLPDWALYLIGALLLTIVLLLVTVLVLVVRKRRLGVWSSRNDRFIK